MKDMDISKILDLLPHRYPFLLVDRVLEIIPGEKAIGIKNVSYNEPFFQGHFPEEPVMPGVLQVEALAQVGALAVLSLSEFANRVVYLAGVEKFRFKGRVSPGDQLLMEVDVTRLRANIGKGEGTIKVDDRVVTSGEFKFAIGE